MHRAASHAPAGRLGTTSAARLAGGHRTAPCGCADAATAEPRCAALRHAALQSPALHCAIGCHTVRDGMRCCTVLYRALLRSTVLYRARSHYATRRNTAPRYATRRYATPRGTTLARRSRALVLEGRPGVGAGSPPIGALRPRFHFRKRRAVKPQSVLLYLQHPRGKRRKSAQPRAASRSVGRKRQPRVPATILPSTSLRRGSERRASR